MLITCSRDSSVVVCFRRNVSAEVDAKLSDLSTSISSHKHKHEQEIGKLVEALNKKAFKGDVTNALKTKVSHKHQNL